MSGSSPLARGLRHRRAGRRLARRIIPARAGFTPRRAVCLACRRDHPRSRGVYRSMHASVSVLGGSSPLARGLHRTARQLVGRRGIIPARAGFTLHDRRHGARGADHPRSRGVYLSAALAASPSDGSSPLARGLHDAGSDDDMVTADHPRSRGVYHKLATHLAEARGSSPLARGLLEAERVHGGLWRIIPARAGFTHEQVAVLAQDGDHPRSRGVYLLAMARGRRSSGSSPLARGLLSRRFSACLRWRIIPARAGFTLVAPASGSTTPDHPRSRGVYGRTVPTGVPREGSSPLARGLPLVWRSTSGTIGIIPARAGFT